MKKSINKLSLNKSTISNLSHSDLSNINGGAKSNGCLPPTFACPSKWSCASVHVCPTLIK
ncbi:MAG: class I lanthipeptide [Bacteroidetes bacterium]|nr:class I lanthipeptide [Bacteroidota bacterium]